MTGDAPTRERANSDSAVRILRIIARLNVGGPAIQAITLTRRLEALGYETKLVRGTEDRHEGTMDDLARELDVAPTLVPSMRRDPGPGDVRAIWSLIKIARRYRPHIIHTHAAKAGALGRVAAMLAFPGDRPILVHTYHGHSLTGYFSPSRANVYRGIERGLARRTDALVAVSQEICQDLVRLGVASADRFAVIPVGLDLRGFVDDTDRDRRRGLLRAEWGVASDERVVTLIARLVPIKRVDRYLRVARRLADRPRTRFVVVGDGELRDQLVESDDARALGDRLLWTGFRRDLPDVCFASDVVTLTSDNEGTPVSLIEAQAAGVPVVGTDVGGVRSAVQAGVTGFLAKPENESEIASAIERLLDDESLSARLGRAGRDYASKAFALERLTDDLDRLYQELQSARHG